MCAIRFDFAIRNGEKFKFDLNSIWFAFFTRDLKLKQISIIRTGHGPKHGFPLSLPSLP
jgi:hypothetical protein